jgi:hypothetical protein
LLRLLLQLRGLTLVFQDSLTTKEVVVPPVGTGLGGWDWRRPGGGCGCVEVSAQNGAVERGVLGYHGEACQGFVVVVVHEEGDAPAMWRWITATVLPWRMGRIKGVMPSVKGLGVFGQ